MLPQRTDAGGAFLAVKYSVGAVLGRLTPTRPRQFATGITSDVTDGDLRQPEATLATARVYLRRNPGRLAERPIVATDKACRVRTTRSVTMAGSRDDI